MDTNEKTRGMHPTGWLSGNGNINQKTPSEPEVIVGCEFQRIGLAFPGDLRCEEQAKSGGTSNFWKAIYYGE